MEIFFEPYASNLLSVLYELKYKFGDGRLLKSIEDFVLANLLKNHIKYDYVVGNPPYVRVQKLSEEQRKLYREMYECASGKFDLFVPFIERGIKWLNYNARLGYITSNLFITRDYGKKLRKYIPNSVNITQLIDFGDSGVFKDVTNYPCIIVLENSEEKKTVKCVKVFKKKDKLINDIREHLPEKRYSNSSYEIFEVSLDFLNEKDGYAFLKKFLRYLIKFQKKAQLCY